MEATKLYIKADKSRYDAIGAIMNRHGADLHDPESMRTQLSALWRLAFSLGSELGAMEGYYLAKEGRPLGQVAHVNSAEETREMPTGAQVP